MIPGKSRVLFVDDERNVLDALSRALRPWQSRWDMAFIDKIEDALAAQKEQPFDVAVVDITMPVMTGLELIRALTAIHAGTLAIILTGATDIATAAAAINEFHRFPLLHQAERRRSAGRRYRHGAAGEACA